MKCPTFTFTLTPEQADLLVKYSAKTGNSKASIIRQAIAEYLENLSQKMNGGTNEFN